MITAINLLVFELLSDRKHGFDPRRSTRVRVAAITTVAALLYGLGRVRQIEHRSVFGSRLKAAIVQGNARPTNVANEGRNRCLVRAAVDPIGRVVIAAPENVATVIGGEVELLDGATVYSRVGNAPWLVLTVLSIASMVVRSRRES